jgi:hypothetical protein
MSTWIVRTPDNLVWSKSTLGCGFHKDLKPILFDSKEKAERCAALARKRAMWYNAEAAPLN